MASARCPPLDELLRLYSCLVEPVLHLISLLEAYSPAAAGPGLYRLPPGALVFRHSISGDEIEPGIRSCRPSRTSSAPRCGPGRTPGAFAQVLFARVLGQAAERLDAEEVRLFCFVPARLRHTRLTARSKRRGRCFAMANVGIAGKITRINWNRQVIRHALRQWSRQFS